MKMKESFIFFLALVFLFGTQCVFADYRLANNVVTAVQYPSLYLQPASAVIKGQPAPADGTFSPLSKQIMLEVTDQRNPSNPAKKHYLCDNSDGLATGRKKIQSVCSREFFTREQLKDARLDYTIKFATFNIDESKLSTTSKSINDVSAVATAVPTQIASWFGISKVYTEPPLVYAGQDMWEPDSNADVFTPIREQDVSFCLPLCPYASPTETAEKLVNFNLNTDSDDDAPISVLATMAKWMSWYLHGDNIMKDEHPEYLQLLHLNMVRILLVGLNDKTNTLKKAPMQVLQHYESLMAKLRAFWNFATNNRAPAGALFKAYDFYQSLNYLEKEADGKYKFNRNKITLTLDGHRVPYMPQDQTWLRGLLSNADDTNCIFLIARRLSLTEPANKRFNPCKTSTFDISDGSLVNAQCKTRMSRLGMGLHKLMKQFNYNEAVCTRKTPIIISPIKAMSQHLIEALKPLGVTSISELLAKPETERKQRIQEIATHTQGFVSQIYNGIRLFPMYLDLVQNCVWAQPRVVPNWESTDLDPIVDSFFKSFAYDAASSDAAIDSPHIAPYLTFVAPYRKTAGCWSIQAGVDQNAGGGARAFLHTSEKQHIKKLRHKLNQHKNENSDLY